MACLGGSRPPPFYYEVWSTRWRERTWPRAGHFLSAGYGARARRVSAEVLRGRPLVVLRAARCVSPLAQLKVIDGPLGNGG
eukprot:6460296-Pyramimonas_sp.AAC.1